MLKSARKANPHVQLAVTRKHFPGKTAFACGGASWRFTAHRLGLSDSLLVLISIVSSGRQRRFRRPVSEYRKAFPEQKLGAEVATRRKPSCWHARASIPSNANVLPVRILKKRVRGVKAVNAAVQVLAAGGVTGGCGGSRRDQGGRAGDDMGLFRQAR